MDYKLQCIILLKYENEGNWVLYHKEFEGWWSFETRGHFKEAFELLEKGIESKVDGS